MPPSTRFVVRRGMQSDEGRPETSQALTPDKRPPDGLELYAKRIALEDAQVPADLGPTADEWASTDDEEDEKDADKGGAASRGAAAAAPSGDLAPVEGFEAAASFLGVRDGKCFRLGAAGLGYYTDRVPDSISMEELQRELMRSPSASAPAEAGPAEAAAPPSAAAPIATPNFAEIKSRFSRAKDTSFTQSMYARALEQEQKLGPGLPLQLGSMGER